MIGRKEKVFSRDLAYKNCAEGRTKVRRSSNIKEKDFGWDVNW